MNSTPKSGSSYRWVICGLLFFATTFNYLDRQVISYLKSFFCAPIDKGGFGWTNTEYANLTSFFTAFYAGMTIIAGWVIDKIGTKIGLALSLIIWSIFGVANAFVGSLVQMHILVRSAFAIGEGGNFPASIKTVAEWFPKRERALATGIFNSGSNFGAMVAALYIPWCKDHYGWKMAFITTGAAGFIWLIFWFWLYEIPARQKRLSKAEFDYIHSDKDDVKTEEKPAKGSAFGKLFSLEGRIPRGTLWGTVILMVILTLFIFLMSSLIVFPNSKADILSFRIAWLACMAWIFIAAMVKRRHDMGSGAPILALGFSEGAPGANEYGGIPTPGVLGHRQTWAFFWGKFLTDG
ncbi:MAG TPA: MFS transporter, partial [Chthoniobacteraceae bacterium]|nr:MFS transporter [Chthoniobacteraceae bacterium]